MGRKRSRAGGRLRDVGLLGAVALLITAMSGVPAGAVVAVRGSTGSAGGWSELDPAASAPARSGAAMAFDQGTGQLILFGGTDGTGSYLDDTWDWNGTTWSELSSGCTSTCSTSPPARSDALMEYDARTGQLILFGGMDGTGAYLDDTWDWNGTSWMQVDDTNHPGCGGASDVCPSSPPGQSGQAMAYDDSTRQLLILGTKTFGDSTASAMWTWSGTAWVSFVPAASPTAGSGAAMAYDAADDQIVLFEYNGSDSENETWTFNGETWSQAAGPPPIPATAGTSLDYDPQLGGVVLTGGRSGSIYYDSTWLWTGSSWAQIDDGAALGCGASNGSACPSSPAPRQGAALVNDSGTGQLLLFGGQDADDNPLNDTWSSQSIVPSYWLTGSTGGVFSFGAAPFDGSVPGEGLHVDNIVGMAAQPGGAGYWLTGATGYVYNFGVAPYDGSLPALGIQVDDVVGIVADPAGSGYWLVTADGGVFAFGGADYKGSVRSLGVHLDDVVGMAADPAGTGYWLTTATGAVYSFGTAAFEGSLPGHGVVADNVVGIAANPAGGGYWLDNNHGGVFSFGSSEFEGSLPAQGVSVANIVGLVPVRTGAGYWLVSATGGVFGFGRGGYQGSLPGDGVRVANIIGSASP